MHIGIEIRVSVLTSDGPAVIQSLNSDLIHQRAKMRAGVVGGDPGGWVPLVPGVATPYVVEIRPVELPDTYGDEDQADEEAAAYAIVDYRGTVPHFASKVYDDRDEAIGNARRWDAVLVALPIVADFRPISR